MKTTKSTTNGSRSSGPYHRIKCLQERLLLQREAVVERAKAEVVAVTTEMVAPLQEELHRQALTVIPPVVMVPMAPMACMAIPAMAPMATTPTPTRTMLLPTVNTPDMATEHSGKVAAVAEALERAAIESPASQAIAHTSGNSAVSRRQHMNDVQLQFRWVSWHRPAETGVGSEGGN
mmetsp:Transcript_26127/g.60926  ORF Transcript_26127/g.60926 Transcript_26127/m.60926 type:complete len:177 (+) Transcript_26127:322-852(+)